MRAVRFGTVFLCLCACLYSGCGLDTYNYVDPPTSGGHTIHYTNEDNTQKYFCFKTTEPDSESEFTFKGTEVYYLIYNNVAAMQSMESSIDSMAASSAAERLISFGYRPLQLSGEATPSPLISAAGQSQYVYIRLTDYNTDNSPDYQSAVCVGASEMNKFVASRLLGFPRRYAGVRYGFNFGKDGDNPVPVSGDSDTYFSSSATTEGTYYIDMYAVGVGLDTTSNSKSYSEVLRLGSIVVRKSD